MSGEHPNIPADRPTDERLATLRLLARSSIVGADIKWLLDEYDGLKNRLRGINSLACYASEEDTDAQPVMLLKIGRVARGEEEVTWPCI